MSNYDCKGCKHGTNHTDEGFKFCSGCDRAYSGADSGYHADRYEKEEAEMSMTESEATEILLQILYDEKVGEEGTKAFQMAIKSLEEIQQYRAIGTVSEFRELKEKATAKKLKHGVCPNCSTNNDMIIKNLGNPQGHKTIFCWNCGSCIDWSEGKE